MYYFFIFPSFCLYVTKKFKIIPSSLLKNNKVLCFFYLSNNFVFVVSFYNFQKVIEQ